MILVSAVRRALPEIPYISSNFSSRNSLMKISVKNSDRKW